MNIIEIWGHDEAGVYTCIKRKTFNSDENGQKGFEEKWSKRRDKQGNFYNIETHEE
jgi:hypothetical protein